MSGHRTFHTEIIETLAETGCVICRLAARSVSRYLDILSYENVNDVALRGIIREGIGLCNRHAWQFIDGTRTPLGTAIIYRDLIRTLQQRTTDAIRPSDGTTARLRGLLPGPPCVACEALAAMVKDCAHQIQQSWADPAFRVAFAKSDGLCWSHVLATLEADRLGRRWRELLAAMAEDPAARLAVEMFCYRISKYVGAYLTVLGGADALIFSGGIGEHCPLVRARVCERLTWCGVHVDPQRNTDTVGNEARISMADSMPVYVIPADEERLIARETVKVIGES